MKRLYFLLILFLFIFSPLFAKTTDIELIKKEISNTQEMSEAEKIRQVATLYRLEGNYEKSFKELKKSLENGLINDLMLEDLAGLAHWLHKEKELKTIALSLFRQKLYKDKLSGLLLKSLLDINKNPEEVLTNLRKFSLEHTSENLNPLFLLLVKRAYSQLGNWERVNYFSHLFQNQFSHYYQPSFPSEKKEINNKKELINPSELNLVQVGSFTSEGHYLLSFLNKLKKLNLKPILEKKEKITQIKIETTNLKKLLETLEKEKIDYFILQSTYPSQEEQEKMAKISWKKEDSIIQVGTFKIYEKAQNFKNTLIKDSFVKTEILYQPQEKLFSVYLKTKNPTELIQKLKKKGYKAFIKYPSKKI